jgi:hypothetical protein
MTVRSRVFARWAALLVGLLPALAAADVLADWDGLAAELGGAAAAGEREAALVDVAMFDAANAVARRYRPALVDVAVRGPADAAAAAATAAASTLLSLHPEAADRIRATLAASLASVHAPTGDGPESTRVGEEVARRVLAARVGDGADAPDTWRAKTSPGQYVPTAPVVGSAWPRVRPFMLTDAAQFRPSAPPSLASAEWATDYREIRALGARRSAERTPAQTEAARFWLMTGPRAYHPLAHQLIAARHLDTVDGARLLAVYAMVLTDTYVAVFEAKYHYEFWRPVTAIRNGEFDGNPDTQGDPAWEPLDATPMHPEYPCAHCALSGAAAAVLAGLGGPGALPEFTLTSTTLPGATHRYPTLQAFTEEVANARIWAGFHYRTSARVGTDMGRRLAEWAIDRAPAPRARAAH